MSILDDVLSGRHDGRGQAAAAPIGADGSPAAAPQRPLEASRVCRRSPLLVDVTSYPPRLRLRRCRCPLVTCMTGRAGACSHDHSFSSPAGAEVACDQGCRSATARFSLSEGLWYVCCTCRCSGCTAHRSPMPIGWSPPGWPPSGGRPHPFLRCDLVWEVR